MHKSISLCTLHKHFTTIIFSYSRFNHLHSLFLRYPRNTFFPFLSFPFGFLLLLLLRRHFLSLLSLLSISVVSLASSSRSWRVLKWVVMVLGLEVELWIQVRDFHPCSPLWRDLSGQLHDDVISPAGLHGFLQRHSFPPPKLVKTIKYI